MDHAPILILSPQPQSFFSLSFVPGGVNAARFFCAFSMMFRARCCEGRSGSKWPTATVSAIIWEVRRDMLTFENRQCAHEHDSHGVGVCFGYGAGSAQELECFGLLVGMLDER